MALDQTDASEPVVVTRSEARPEAETEPDAWYLRVLRWPGLPVVVMLALVLLYNAEAVLTDRTLLAAFSDSDVSDSFRPVAINQFDEIARFGSLGSWQRQLGLGYMPTGQWGNLYPIRTLVLALAPTAATAADLLATLHLVWAALAVYALARVYNLDRWPAAFAGTTFVLANGVVRWTPLYHAPVHFAGLATAVLGTELIWHATRRRPALGVGLLGLGLGISVLGGHLQAAGYTWIAVGVLLSYRLITSSPPAGRLRALGASAAGLGLGLGIGLPALVDFLGEATRASRAEVPYAAMRGLTGLQLSSLIDPRAVVGDVNADLFLGIFGFALVAVGVVVAARDRQRRALIVLTLVLLVLGSKNPVTALLVELPGARASTNLARISTVLLLPLAVFAGLGLQTVLRSVPRWPMLFVGVAALVASALFWLERTGAAVPLTAAVVAGTLLLFALAAAAVADREPATRRWYTGPMVVAPLLACTVMATTAAAAVSERQAREPVSAAYPMLWRATDDRIGAFGETERLIEASGDPGGRWMSFCQSALGMAPGGYRANLGAATSQHWLDVYESFMPRSYERYWRRLVNAPPDLRTESGRHYEHPEAYGLPDRALVDRAGVTRAIGPVTCPLDASPLGWKWGSAAYGQAVYENPGAYPLAYTTSRWIPTPPREQLREILEDPVVEFARHTDYIDARRIRDRSSSSPATATSRRPTARAAQMRWTDPDRFVVRVGAHDAGDMLVVLDSYHRGWRAYADGREVPIRRAGAVFKAVRLDEGTRQVVFEFSPPGPHRIAVLLAWVCALVAAALIVVGLVRFRRVHR